jgi:hypothetical protein
MFCSVSALNYLKSVKHNRVLLPKAVIKSLQVIS